MGREAGNCPLRHRRARRHRFFVNVSVFSVASTADVISDNEHELLLSEFRFIAYGAPASVCGRAVVFRVSVLFGVFSVC